MWWNKRTQYPDLFRAGLQSLPNMQSKLTGKDELDSIWKTRAKNHAVEKMAEGIWFELVKAVFRRTAQPSLDFEASCAGQSVSGDPRRRKGCMTYAG